MSDFDLETVSKGATAIKTSIDAFRGAVRLLREAKDSLPASNQTETVGRALDEAEKSAKAAEAQLAQALGYELCKAHFPPVIMLDVGFYTDRPTGKPLSVFECPRCGRSTRTMTYTRTAPTRERPGA
jgi:hypothetical protein